MAIKKKTTSHPKAGRKASATLIVDLASILSVDHACNSCLRDERCCCSVYEVCVTAAELERIIPVLPEAARSCPHLKGEEGYDNIFDEVEPGLFAIDTDDDGLCLLAFRKAGKIRCSLHAAAALLGLPPELVKPKACLLWPLNFSEGKEFLSLVDDALDFRCTTPRRGSSRKLAPAFVKAVEGVYGKAAAEQLVQAAASGVRRTKVVCRR